MTKKDYELIAGIIGPQVAKAKANGWGNSQHPQVWKLCCTSIALDFADALAQGNPRFDRERFLKACGVES